MTKIPSYCLALASIGFFTPCIADDVVANDFIAEDQDGERQKGQGQRGRAGARPGAAGQAGQQRQRPGQQQGQNGNPAGRRPGAGGPMRDMTAMIPRLITQFDQDGDQKLDATELTAMFQMLQQRRGQAGGPGMRPGGDMPNQRPGAGGRRRPGGDSNETPGGQKPKRPGA